MASVTIVGGGPAGLSAGVFASKNGLDVTVYDTDGTWMHKAHLFNYLGIGSVGGSEFIEIARQQAEDFGVDLKQDHEVTGVEVDGEEFHITSEEGEITSDYLVLATGADRSLAEEIGCEFNENGTVNVDVTMETSINDAYATGAMVRAEEWQAVISAGDGAAAALNILTKERGDHFHDFDVPADATAAFGEMRKDAVDE
ncbi:NAD(P)/FAD-dependent oxidoreductase [Salinarchaeum sp. IM2453]|uniref:NAD(P)/FAD-dependent oxidoreductase n=1 Tax=Salinarchaeum sp. IM2453 TaxID=2862870 RepID=UPI001C836F45|nr:NAD(P)/FAD-dependent oxidoreductase [Salinarchaeum sp. IM2453]QZA89328.1 NAD(P)/FAD-dependent oxidoreductase [Salinarchaeum sp. IM2453]